MFWLCTQAITEIHFQLGLSRSLFMVGPTFKGDISSIIVVCQFNQYLEI